MRIVAFILGVLLSSILIACSNSETTNRKPDNEVATREAFKQVLLAADVSSELVNCTPLSCDSEAGRASMVLTPDNASITLTAGERRLVAGWTGLDGSHCYIEHTIMAAMNYYLVTGTLPPTGADLLSYRISKREISSLRPSNKELVTKFCVGLNPVTGQYYRTFGREGFSPGGIFIEPAQDQGGENVGDDPMRPTVLKVFRVKIYGETPDKVLYDNYFARGIELNPDVLRTGPQSN